MKSYVEKLPNGEKVAKAVLDLHHEFLSANPEAATPSIRQSDLEAAPSLQPSASSRSHVVLGAFEEMRARRA